MTTTPIFYTISADFVPYAAVALQSLVTFARPGDHYQVIFLHEDLTSVDQTALGDLATSQVAVAFYQLDPTVLAGIANRPENFLRADFYTPAIFYRLFIADLFPQYDRALYVDADSVWAADPAPLVNHPLNGQLIAAAPDLSVAHVEPMQEYIRGAIGVPGGDYINSGVLVLNLKRLRDEGFSQHFLKLAQSYHFDCIAPDQDYLNAICHGQIEYLKEEFNAMPKDPAYASEAVAHPTLIHYNLFYKPWHFGTVMYGEQFWQIASETPFASQLRAELTGYGKEDQEGDRAKLDRLMAKAGQLATATPSFASVEAASGEVRL